MSRIIPVIPDGKLDINARKIPMLMFSSNQSKR